MLCKINYKVQSIRILLENFKKLSDPFTSPKCSIKDSFK